MLAIGMTVVVVAVTAVALTWWFNRSTTRLEVVDVVVSSGGSEPLNADNNEWQMVPPKVLITLRNIGDQVSVITGARIEVVDYTHLPICWGAGGALESSQTYNVTLPIDPPLPDVIDVDVSQEIPPDRADRFELAMQLAHPDPALGTYLYRLKVSLTRDGRADVIDVGHVIVAAPLVNSVPFSRADTETPDEMGACFSRVAAEYRRAQGWEGKRSPDLLQPAFTD